MKKKRSSIIANLTEIGSTIHEKTEEPKSLLESVFQTSEDDTEPQKLNKTLNKVQITITSVTDFEVATSLLKPYPKQLTVEFHQTFYKSVSTTTKPAKAEGHTFSFKEVFVIDIIGQGPKANFKFTVKGFKGGDCVTETYLDSLPALKIGEEKSLHLALSGVQKGYLNIKVVPQNFNIGPFPCLKKSDKPPKTAKYVVIGGGFAGSQAAASLFKRKEDVILLEANKQLGGRCYPLTLDVKGSKYTFDAGCGFISESQNMLYQYVTEVYKDDLKPLLVDTVQMRHGPGSGESSLANPMNSEVFEDTLMVYDVREAKLGISSIPTQASFKETALLGLTMVKISLIQNIINIDDPLGKNENYPKRMKKHLSDLDNQPYQDWIDEQFKLSGSIMVKDILGISVEAPLSINAKEISTLYYFTYSKANGGFLDMVNDDADGPQQYLLRNSFIQVIDRITKPLKDSNRIFLNSIVKSIDAQKDKKAVITLTDDTTITADYVIWAGGISAASKVNFTEGTIKPQRSKLFKNPMGRTIKGFLTYSEPWWRNSKDQKKSYSGYVGASENPLKPQPYTKDKYNTIWLYDVSYEKEMLNEKPVYSIQFFIVAEYADKLVKETPEDKLEATIKKICQDHAAYYFSEVWVNPKDSKKYDLYNPKAYENIGFKYRIWNPETDYTHGGPNTCFTTGVYSNCIMTPKAIGNLYFAGSEYARVYRGYMTGALGNGENTANTLLEKEKKPVFPKTFLNEPVASTKYGKKLQKIIYQKPSKLSWWLYEGIDFLMDNLMKLIKHFSNDVHLLKDLLRAFFDKIFKKYKHLPGFKEEAESLLVFRDLFLRDEPKKYMLGKTFHHTFRRHLNTRRTARNSDKNNIKTCSKKVDSEKQEKLSKKFDHLFSVE